MMHSFLLLLQDDNAGYNTYSRAQSHEILIFVSKNIPDNGRCDITNQYCAHCSGRRWMDDEV